jgi:hypothetical protein
MHVPDQVISQEQTTLSHYIGSWHLALRATVEERELRMAGKRQVLRASLPSFFL